MAITELQMLEILIKDLAFQDSRNENPKVEIGYNVEYKGFTAACQYRGQSIYSDIMPTVTGATMSLWVELSEAKKEYLNSK
jgi:hypothetical protein